MRRLTLIRHGLTEGNVRRWYYGALDLPLCETGKSALREAAAGGLPGGPVSQLCAFL